MATKRRQFKQFNCITATQNETTLYVFTAKAKELETFLSINRRDTDEDTGYQRVLQPSRVRAVRRFVEEKKCVAPALVASLDDGAEYDAKAGVLKIPKKADAGWVIDGQHRLAGSGEAENDIELVVVAFIGLSVEDQIYQFVTINREAKGVPTSLYYDLLKHLPTKKTPTEQAKERASDIANELKKNEESPFFSRVTIGSPAPGKEISLVNFVRKVQPLIMEGRILSAYNAYEQMSVIDNYFRGLKAIHPEFFRSSPSIVFRTLGFGALMNALPTVFTFCLGRFNAFRVEDVAQLFETVDFDFSSWEQLGSGNAAEVQAGKDLEESIRAKFQDSEEAGILRLE